MLSRQANNLYWMSRQIERAENTARLLDVNLHFLADLQVPCEICAGARFRTLLPFMATFEA